LAFTALSARTWFCATLLMRVLYFFSQPATILASPLKPWTMKGGAPLGWMMSQFCSASSAISFS
jgi:hypothetical protein